MQPTIIDRGRGPEISGTRITVYDILDYSKHNWTPNSIAAWLDLSTDQVLVALQYIEEHKTEVLAEYQAILERCARGNPPELQARLDADHVKFLEMVKQRRLAKSQGENHAGDSRGY